jgi:membrane fusion protein, heavy metal efflux system
MTAHATFSRLTTAIVCLSALLPGGCRRTGGPEPAASAAAASATPDAGSRPTPAAPERPPRLQLEAAQLGQIKIEELSTRSGAGVIRATGTVEFNADRIARILAPVAGQVQELRLNVGDDVKRGDTVFVLSSREVAAAIAEHLASQKDLDLSEKTFAMTKDLFEHDAASRMAMQQSENEVAKARAKVAQTAEVLRVLGFDESAVANSGTLPSHVPIRAPLSGIVTERTITNGQFVGVESTPLMTIADLSSVWVQADVFERDLHSIAAGEKADVTTAAYPDDHFSAEVARVGTVVDAQTRTAKIRFVTANPGLRLKPGMFTTATLQIPGSSSNTALTAPAKAVFVEGGRSFAYVQTGAAEFERREVGTEPAGDNRVRITRGLSIGDRVVTDGVLLLRARETDGTSE